LRRPTVLEKWYSKTEDEWEKMSEKRKRQWSHIGRIEETEDGGIVRACLECEKKSWICKKYTVAAQERLKNGLAHTGLGTCSRCRANQKPCISDGTAQSMAKTSLRARVKALEDENEQLKRKIRRAEVELSI
jgi:hypothetical protein